MTSLFNQSSSKSVEHNRKGAAGWALLVWLFGGGLGLALAVFIILKVIGA
jgi:hypothetical protein